VIIFLTSIPNPPIPRELAAGDKLVHFGMYFGFGFLLARAVLQGSSPTFTILSTVVVGVIIAALDEWHQQFIPGRSMDIADWRADGAGVALGVVIAVAAHLAARRRIVVKSSAKP
jgi:VanZ family protein